LNTLKTRNVLAGLAAMAIAAGLTACGASGGTDTATEAAAGGQVIDVTAVDYKFEGLPDTLEKGPVTVNFSNEGKEAHMMVFGKVNEGYTLDDVIKAQGEDGTATQVGVITPVEPGADSTTPIKGEITQPGHYFMLCPLKTKDGKNHFELGQEYEFDVQ
jgi:ABC-type glycerol-3-phosphate transport system substrate-binding protein